MIFYSTGYAGYPLTVTDNLTTLAIDSLIDQYKNAAFLHGLYYDSNKINEQHAKICAIYQELRRRGGNQQHQLLALLDDPMASVRCWAAAHALEFSPERGAPVLEELAKSEKSLAGFNAEMTLKEWRKGTLKFP